jgi:drug/metabolite transporter (DMT)-like permease
LLGIFGTVAHLLMTWSLRYAPSATLAPMQYLEIPFATAFGFLLFGDFPDDMALLGIAMTIASGLYILVREEKLRRIQAIETPAE